MVRRLLEGCWRAGGETLLEGVAFSGRPIFAAYIKHIAAARTYVAGSVGNIVAAVVGSGGCYHADASRRISIAESVAPP